MDEENLLLLCRRCHRLQHQVGWARFIHQNPQIGFELDKRGWRLSMVGSGRTAVLKLVRE